MFTLDEARRRVARGAALLDAEVPGWVQRVDPGLLALESCTSCLLGQLFGDYVTGYRCVVLPRRMAAAQYGFDITMAESRGIRRVQYRRLTDAWLEAIASRVVQPATELATVAD